MLSQQILNTSTERCHSGCLLWTTLLSPQMCLQRDKHTKMHTFKLDLNKTNGALFHYSNIWGQYRHTEKYTHVLSQQRHLFKTSLSLNCFHPNSTALFGHVKWERRHAKGSIPFSGLCLPDALCTLRRFLCNPCVYILFPLIPPFRIFYLPRTTFNFKIPLTKFTKMVFSQKPCYYTLCISLNSNSALCGHIFLVQGILCRCEVHLTEASVKR